MLSTFVFVFVFTSARLTASNDQLFVSAPAQSFNHSQLHSNKYLIAN